MKSDVFEFGYRKTPRIRQDIRVPASFLVEIIFSNRQAVFGKFEDLSLNGAKISLPISLLIGSQIVLNLTNHKLALKGVCLWTYSQDWEAISYLSGIRFINVNTIEYAELRQILFNLAG